ncbi:MAG: chlorinating enzyme [Myxococcales bacterium]|nr:chlorinating enzyme [Myxococcales bacterium]
MGLSQQELDAFERDGWVGPFDLFEPAVAARLLSRIRAEVIPVRCEIYAHTRGELEFVDYKRDRHLDSPLAFRIASAPEIVSRASSLLGPDVLLWRSDAFEQGIGDPATAPHQDGAFEATRRTHPLIEAGEGQQAVAHQTDPFDVRIPLSIGAWITLTPVTKKRGSLWVVPGTHKELITEVPGEGFAGMKTVPSRHFEPSDGHAIEIEAGQFILFHNLVVHGSYPVEEGRRFAWTTRYVSTETRIHPRSTINAQGQDLSRWGAVLVSGQDRARRNVMRAPPAISNASILEERALAHATAG